MKDSALKRLRIARMEKEASVWALRLDRGLTPAEQDSFLDWMAADPGHGPLLASYCRDWNRLLLLAQWQPEHSAQPNPDLLAPPLRRRLVLLKPLWLGAMAAAAALAVLYFRREETGRAERTASVIPAAEVALPSANSTRVLPDGSRIELHGGTLVDVRYSPQGRHVTIENGEAHFTVAKDPARPFVVSARGVDVRALGTIFNVKIESSAVEVLVTEGRVRVDSGLDRETATPTLANSSGSPPALIESLAANQRASISLSTAVEAPRVETLTPGEISRALAWQHRLLVFKAVALGEIIAEFNRRNVVRLVVEDPELATMPITASFRSDNIEGLINLLQAGFGAQPEHVNESLIVLRKGR